jgi:hypothetical protein
VIGTRLDPRFQGIPLSNREIPLFEVSFGSRTWYNLDPERRTAMAEATVLEEQVTEEREPQWELAECTCPDWCERDHEQD